MKEKKKRTAASQIKLDTLTASISEQVKGIRESKKWKPKQLAEKSHCSVQMIHMVERNERTTSFGTLHDIAFGMGYRVEVNLVEI